MKVSRIEGYTPRLTDNVEVIKMGNIIDIKKIDIQRKTCPIEKLNSDEYLVKSTGEVCKFLHTENRSQNIRSVRCSISVLRQIINTNFVGGSNELFITLTYGKDKVYEPKKLSYDFQKFIQRLRYKFKGQKIDYIYIPEPHEKGDWHIHLLLKSDTRLFIPNKELNKLWGHGFVKVNRLKEVDNIGAYVSAYLIDVKDGDITKKGARLPLYPTHHQLYRASKGILYPEVLEMKYFEAKKMVNSSKLTFSSTVEIFDENTGFRNKIHHEYYNSKRH